jgi:hypothetical protein
MYVAVQRLSYRGPVPNQVSTTHQQTTVLVSNKYFQACALQAISALREGRPIKLQGTP